MSLKREARTVGKHTVIYGMAGVLGQLVGFIMLPVYTRYLTPSDYGIMDLVGITAVLLTSVISVGISAAMTRFYFDGKNIQERREVISTGIITFSTLALVSVMILSMLTKQFSSLILGSPGYASLFLISFATIWTGTLVDLGQNYLKIRRWSVIFLVVSVSRLIVALSLNIYFVVVLRKGVAGILLSNLITSTLFSALLIVPILAAVGLRISWSKCVHMLRFGAPLVVSNIARNIVNRSDRYFINAFGGSAATGLYSLGYKFGTLGHMLVASPFQQIWFPRRIEKHKMEDSDEIFARVFTYFLFLNMFAGLGVSILVKDVLKLMATEQYLNAYRVVPLIILAHVVFALFSHFSINIYIAKKTKYIAYVDMAGALLNLMLNYVLIKQFMVWGAAAATILCFMFRSGMTYVTASRICPIRFEAWRSCHLLLCAISVYWISTLFEFEPLWLDLVLKTLVALSYPLLLVMTGFLRSDERHELRSMWLRMRGRSRGT